MPDSRKSDLAQFLCQRQYGQTAIRKGYEVLAKSMVITLAAIGLVAVSFNVDARGRGGGGRSHGHSYSHSYSSHKAIHVPAKKRKARTQKPAALRINLPQQHAASSSRHLNTHPMPISKHASSHKKDYTATDCRCADNLICMDDKDEQFCLKADGKTKMPIPTEQDAAAN